MSFSKKLLIASAFTLLASSSFAADETAGQKRADEVNQRVENQDARIEQGIKKDELTNKEKHQLERKETKVGADVAKAESDGKVTKAEAKKLNHEETRQGLHIHDDKHNTDTTKK